MLHLSVEQLLLETLVPHAGDTVAGTSGEMHLSCFPHQGRGCSSFFKGELVITIPTSYCLELRDLFPHQREIPCAEFRFPWLSSNAARWCSLLPQFTLCSRIEYKIGT